MEARASLGVGAPPKIDSARRVAAALGYGEQIEPMVTAWESGDRQAAAAAAPWELIEDMFIFGTPEQMKERLDAFVAGFIGSPAMNFATVTVTERDGRLAAAVARMLGQLRRRRQRVHPGSPVRRRALRGGGPGGSEGG